MDEDIINIDGVDYQQLIMDIKGEELTILVPLDQLSLLLSAFSQEE